MKNLAKKQKQIYHVSVSTQLYETVKEITMALLNIFIFVSCYYIFMCTYNFSEDNHELISICTTNFEELEPVNQSKVWYKSILDDFFNKFTSNSKTINYKFIEIKLNKKILIPLEQNTEIVKKSVILNKIQSDNINSIISECEFYKNKSSLLEIQLLNTKIAYHNLVKDINDMVKEMNYSLKNS